MHPDGDLSHCPEAAFLDLAARFRSVLTPPGPEADAAARALYQQRLKALLEGKDASLDASRDAQDPDHPGAEEPPDQAVGLENGNVDGGVRSGEADYGGDGAPRPPSPPVFTQHATDPLSYEFLHLDRGVGRGGIVVGMAEARPRHERELVYDDFCDAIFGLAGAPRATP